MGQLRIVIVDDDAIDRRSLRRALTKSGLDCNLAEASVIQEAVEICSAKAIDCAIVDYRLPGVSGLDGIKILKERRPDLAVVMVTGQGDETIARDAIQLGAEDYIPKSDLDPGLLRRTVERAYEKAGLRRKLKERTAELERFARILAHDFRSPLKSISMIASRAMEKRRRGVDARWERSHQDILSITDSMNALLDELTIHTGIEESSVLREFALDEALDIAMRNLAETIESRQAVVTRARLPTVRANKSQLAQLFQNLIANSIKYCEAETPEVRISAQQVESGWRIGIEDNGIGVAPEYRDRIFDPFERLHTRSEYPGTGLGLATCRKIIERHRGQIWCGEPSQGGAVFYFLLRDDLSPSA